MKRQCVFVMYLVAVMLCTGTAYAGAGNRTGTNGASELLIPVGTRDIAMGGSTVSTASGVEALFWNPAAVAKIRNSVELYVSHMSYIADIGVNYGAVSANFEGFGVFSLSLKSLAIDEIPVTTTRDPDGTGQMFKPQFFTVGLSFARQLSDRIAVGLTMNIMSERMGEVSANGVAFSTGVVYDNLGSIDGLSIGVVIKNIGPVMRFDGSGLLVSGGVSTQNRPPQLYTIQAAPFELPSSIELGASYRRNLDEANRVLLSTAFLSNNFSDDEYRLGAEYSYQDLFFVRAGYNFAQKESDQRQFIFGPTVGAGVRYALGSVDVAIDYAFRSAKTFDNNHVFSVKLGF